MAKKLKKRKGYKALSNVLTGNLTNNATLSIGNPGQILTIGGTSGISWGTTTVPYTTITDGYYSLVEYESLAPVAIKDVRTGLRLIVWEP